MKQNLCLIIYLSSKNVCLSFSDTRAAAGGMASSVSDGMFAVAASVPSLSSSSLHLWLACCEVSRSLSVASLRGLVLF